jgi:hypothetical protein
VDVVSAYGLETQLVSDDDRKEPRYGGTVFDILEWAAQRLTWTHFGHIRERHSGFPTQMPASCDMPLRPGEAAIRFPGPIVGRLPKEDRHSGQSLKAYSECSSPPLRLGGWAAIRLEWVVGAQGGSMTLGMERALP